MTVEDDTLAKTGNDDDVIAECIARLAISVAADGENRSMGLDDLAFLNGDQWDPVIQAQRTRDQRPCLTINKLPTFLHQVTNSQRQNVPSIKVHPVSDGDAEIAEIVQGAIRHIEYASNADVCYDTAVNSAAAIGFGYFRMVTDYCSPESFDQEIKFKRIRNSFTVYMDPAHIEPDGSDQQWCILSVKVPRTEFKLEYPDADPCNFGEQRGTGDVDADWVSADQVRIAEYYRIYREKATTVLLSNGESGWEDKLMQLPPGVTIVQKRESLRPTVQWFKLTAAEVLDRADIPCKWIPVFPVYGDEIDIDGKVHRSGLVRNAKDPARQYNFWTHQALDTPIATPSGWATIGSLKTGDQVFADTGAVANVIGKSPVYIGNDCYRVTFGDGTSVVSSDEHLWSVQERGEWKPKTLRTDELDTARHLIKVAGPVQMPLADLPVHPYFLGHWLGDGTAAAGQITPGDEDIDEVMAALVAVGCHVGEKRKYGPRAASFTTHGEVGKLRDLGVLSNKHIPALYLRASVEQRYELLRGLMDSDGSISSRNHCCCYSGSDEVLMRGVAELLASLGIRCGTIKRAARVNAQINGRAVESGPSIQLMFSPPADVPIFKLSRKLAVQFQTRKRTPRRTEFHKIKAVERVASVPVQCIGIDAPSHLYLCGTSMVPTHNTAATEEIALRPKTPYIGAEGQFEGHEREWADANTSSYPFLEYKPKALGGMLAPPPMRQPMAAFPDGLMAMGRNANDDIKATTGIFDASLGARSNETSGVAIKRRDQQGETSNYHFTDNLHITLRHVGRCIVDMWPKVYDGSRTLRILGEDKKMSSVEINKPIPPEEQKPDPKTGAVKTILNDMSVGEYDVTIGVGPAYDTLRQEAVDGMLQTVQSWPKLMEVAGDKIVRAMDWPGAEEIADRIEKTLPPELRDVDPDEEAAGGPPPIPPEVQQHMDQQEKALHDLMDQLDQAKSGLEKARIDAASRERVAEINAEGRNDVAELTGMVQLLLQRMQPPPMLAGAVADDLTSDDANDQSRPSADPAPEQGAQGGLPMGANMGPEITQ